MKKLLLLLALLTSSSTFAVGLFDGIWEISLSGESDFATIHQNGDSIIVMFLSPDDQIWEAYSGTIDGLTVDLTLVVGQGIVTSTLLFTDTTSGTFTINSCTTELPNTCNNPPGTSFHLTKIF